MAEPESSAPSAIGSSPAWRDEPFRRLVEGVRDYAIFLLDTEGNVASWNLGAERLKGYKPSEIIGRHFSTFYTQAAIDKRWPQHELETAARLGRFEDEGWRVRKDGTLFWANVVITAMRDRDGRLLGYSKITRDLTERRENEERLRRSEERFRLIIEGVEDYAIFLLDPTGHVQSWNKGAERIKGYREPEIIGKHFSIFYPPEALDVDWPAKELREAERAGRFEDEGWRLQEGRHALLGQRGDHGAARRGRHAARLLEDHARPHRAARERGAAAPERGALPAAARGRRGLRRLHARHRPGA